MSELAGRLFDIIQIHSPASFSVLWAHILDDTSFSEMEDALAELIDAHKIVQLEETLFAIPA